MSKLSDNALEWPDPDELTPEEELVLWAEVRDFEADSNLAAASAFMQEAKESDRYAIVCLQRALDEEVAR